jgi:hypothetical protein
MSKEASESYLEQAHDCHVRKKCHPEFCLFCMEWQKGFMSAIEEMEGKKED